MATFTKLKLSGSVDGKAIKITQTATPGDTLHQAAASDLDEIWLWAFNSSGSDVLLTIEWGGTTDPDNIIEKTIPAQDGLYLLVPGHLLTNSLYIKAFAATANVITINGFVNRIS